MSTYLQLDDQEMSICSWLLTCYGVGTLLTQIGSDIKVSAPSRNILSRMKHATLSAFYISSNNTAHFHSFHNSFWPCFVFLCLLNMKWHKGESALPVGFLCHFSVYSRHTTKTDKCYARVGFSLDMTVIVVMRVISNCRAVIKHERSCMFTINTVALVLFF